MERRDHHRSRAQVDPGPSGDTAPATWSCPRTPSTTPPSGPRPTSPTSDLHSTPAGAARLRIPADTRPGQTIHVILEATDNGSPALSGRACSRTRASLRLTARSRRYAHQRGRRTCRHRSRPDTPAATSRSGPNSSTTSRTACERAADCPLMAPHCP
ncbi:hypothetical protein [Haloactinopolyspora alba]|uniref:hypothetical protein n=1 Tax=Haloactinopolyspora alba TaxID=648780 RepID=UPI003B84AB74